MEMAVYPRAWQDPDQRTMEPRNLRRIRKGELVIYEFLRIWPRSLREWTIIIHNTNSHDRPIS